VGSGSDNRGVGSIGLRPKVIINDEANKQINVAR
jgi:hypothetical protein